MIVNTILQNFFYEKVKKIYFIFSLRINFFALMKKSFIILTILASTNTNIL